MSVTNLYPPFSSSSGGYSNWTNTGDYYLNQPVYRKASQYGGMYNNIPSSAGYYVYSIYVKVTSTSTALFTNMDAHNTSNYSIINAGCDNPNVTTSHTIVGGVNYRFSSSAINVWCRLWMGVYLSSSSSLEPYVTITSTDGNNVYISAPMLETGETLHDFVPYGGWIWHAHEGEYPINDLTPPVLQTDFRKPYPCNYWRIDESNGGYPYNDLMPAVMYASPIPPPPPPPAPTIDPVEFYDEYNAEYLSALYQKHRWYKVRLELLGYYENVVGEITRDLSRGASGSITINNEQITRRSCNLSLINVEKKYLPSPDSPIWFNRKFKLWIGIVTGKHTYWWSYGVFFTTKATCDGATLNIQGIDKGGALDGTIKTGMLDAENVIERGTTLTNLIKDTLMWNEFSSPYLRHNTGASSYPVDPIAPIIDTKFDKITTQAEITINANDYISTLFSSIADGYGADAYYNTNGHFVFQTMADDSRIDGYRFMAHQWDFKDTDEMYSNASVEYNMDGFNVVTVYTNESTLENVSYTASNNNPASPLRLDSAGIRRMSDVEIPYINVAQNEMVDRCKAYADYLLMKEAMDRMSLTFTCPIIPHLDVNRTIGVTDKRYNLESATFIINSITMPLSAESMTINATSTEWLPDDTSIEGGAV